MKKSTIFQVLAGASLMLVGSSVYVVAKSITKTKQEASQALLALLAKTESEEERKMIIQKLGQLN